MRAPCTKSNTRHFYLKETFARANFNPKTHQHRHSRIGGNPVKLLIRLDSRLRENDDNWRFYIKLLISLHAKVSNNNFVQNPLIIEIYFDH